jgi:hypothetical protein
MESSECNRAFYDGKTDKWLPTPKWRNHSGYDRDTRQMTAIEVAEDPWDGTAIATPQRTDYQAVIEPVAGEVI